MARARGRSARMRRQRTRAFGIATWIALVFAIAIVGFALLLTTMPERKPAVGKPYQTSARLPEPSFLLDNAAALRLTSDQIRHVRIVNREWQMKRAAFDAQFKSASTDADSVLSDLRAKRSLPYGVQEIATEFEKARAKFWKDATSELNTRQQAIIQKLASENDGKRSSQKHVNRHPQPSKNHSADSILSDLDANIATVKADLKAVRSKFGSKSRITHEYEKKLSSLQRDRALMKSGKYVARGQTPVRRDTMRLIPIAPSTEKMQLLPYMPPSIGAVASIDSQRKTDRRKIQPEPPQRPLMDLRLLDQPILMFIPIEPWKGKPTWIEPWRLDESKVRWTKNPRPKPTTNRKDREASRSSAVR